MSIEENCANWTLYTQFHPALSRWNTGLRNRGIQFRIFVEIRRPRIKSHGSSRSIVSKWSTLSNLSTEFVALYSSRIQPTNMAVILSFNEFPDQ